MPTDGYMELFGAASRHFREYAGGNWRFRSLQRAHHLREGTQTTFQYLADKTLPEGVQIDLPAWFCVWALGKEISFLHGRFVWAQWDEEVLKRIREQIKEDAKLLRVGLQGIKVVNIATADYLVNMTRNEEQSWRLSGKRSRRKA